MSQYDNVFCIIFNHLHHSLFDIDGDFLFQLYDAPPRSVETQTICEADRPPTPVFERLSPGVEVGTQILPGELFHFDTEVTPILDVLVGKTIEQSLTEVFEEDELAALRQHQRLLRETRDTEVAEEQRLQAAESRRQEQLVSIFLVMYTLNSSRYRPNILQTELPSKSQMIVGSPPYFFSRTKFACSYRELHFTQLVSVSQMRIFYLR